MKLNRFVEQALIEICEGVVKAQLAAPVTISPARINGEAQMEASQVNFELTVSDSNEAGGGINVLSAAQAKAAKKVANKNTISFSVPVHFNSRNVYQKSGE